MSLQQLTTQVSASPLDNTQILQIRATAQTAKLAADLSNTVAQVFVQQQTSSVTAQLTSTATKLAQNLQKAQAALDNDQAQLATLQNNHASADSIARQNDLISNDQVSRSTLQANYDQVQQQLLQAPNTLSIVQSATPPTSR